ncbi:hypothetical protein [Nocardia jejuensis]|uniref:hypothetical protein n=1 Tax=Nocardia jejuensis TaxID=328049 RepID=UPI000831868F|nr:hypothetical protein [Nocardia jejuensis]
MESGNELEDLRSALSCVYRKLEAETLTHPDSVELVARAGTLEDRIDTILDAVEVEAETGDRLRPNPDSSSDTLF